MSFKEALHYKLIDLEHFQIDAFNLFLVFFILLSTWIGVRIIKRVFTGHKRNRRFSKGQGHSIYLICKYLFWVIAVMVCLQVLGVQITILLAGSAALLVGLGLGIQQIFNDLVSGVFLLFEGSVRVNDILEVDEMVCRVKEIRLRTSLVETRDSIIKIVPNHKFISDTVTNWSRQTTKNARFKVVMGVSYKSDPKHVREVLTNVMNKHPQILQKEPFEPFVRFIDYNDSSIDLELVFWSERMFQVDTIISDLRYTAFDRFREEGIEIPFPQRDLHIKSSDIGPLR